MPPSVASTPIPTVQTTSVPKVAPTIQKVAPPVQKAAPTAIPTVASAPVPSEAKPSVRSKIDKARAAATLGKRKAVEVANNQTKESAVRGTPMSSVSKGKEKEKLKTKAAVGKQKVAIAVSNAKAVESSEKSSSANASKSTAAADPMNRAVRAGTRLPIIRNREIQTRESKGKEKEVDPMSRAVKSVDGWKPINARKKPTAVAATVTEAAPSLEAKTKAKTTKAKVSASVATKSKAKKPTAAATKKPATVATKAKTTSEKATAKTTTTTTKKTVTTKRTVSRKQPATTDEAEASTSAAAETKKTTVRKPVVRKAIKRKRVPIVPLKKRKIPVIRTPKPKPLPPPLITLDEFQADPMNDDFLDRPMSDFIKDDRKGIVSKMFKEFEEARMKKRKREDTPHQNAAASTSQTQPDAAMPDNKRQKQEESKPIEDTALEER